METETSVETSTITSWSSAKGEEFEKNDFEDVHDYLSSKIDRLNQKIATWLEIEKNNISEEVTVEDDQVIEFVDKSRLKRINSLAEVLKDQKLLDYTPFPTHVKLDIVMELKQEINELENLLIQSKKELIDSKEELASLENKIRSLDEIMEKRKTEGEMVQEESSEAFNRALHQEFMKHKRELNKLLNELYPDDKDEIREVLRRAVDKYFEEGDDYIELSSDNDYCCLEFLFEADVLERHPYDENKIKLAKFFD